MKFKPMLAGKADTDIRFPVLASPKLDGIRCIITEKGPVTRKLLPIPNKELFELWSRPELKGLDGEIICGNPADPNAMQNTTSKVSRRDGGVRDVVFHAFDVVDDWNTPTQTYTQRYEFLRNWCVENSLNRFRVSLVQQESIKDMKTLAQYEEYCVSWGYEGVMIRDPQARYKFGRSSTKEGILLKVKRMEDTEGIIVGFEELEHNTNVATRDELGRTKRSTAKAGKVASGKLGAFVVRCPAFPDLADDDLPKVGTGFTEAQRVDFWARREELLDKVITLRYQPTGVLDKPRFPSFKGFRED